MSTLRITALAERLKAREKDHGSIPSDIAKLFAESQAPIFAWASDVDLALVSLGEKVDGLAKHVVTLQRTEEYWRQVAKSKAGSYNVPEPVIVPSVLSSSPPPPPRFVDNGNGTISDDKTGLMWRAGPCELSSWDFARVYCRGLTIGGHTDWRLPSVEELLSIVDYGRHDPACDPVFGTLPSFYWSSSTYVYASQLAWGVCFSRGYVSADLKTYRNHVRAVRGLAKP